MKPPKCLRPGARFVPLVLLGLLSLTASPSFSAETYPRAKWAATSPEKQGMRSDVLAGMMRRIKKQSYHFDSILVVRNGHLVLDAYFWPFPKGYKHAVKSCTKSVMSALIGIAIDKGFIKGVDQPVTDFFPDDSFTGWDAAKKAMTLEHLLMMASGLECRDSYRYGWTGLYRMRSSPDWARYVLNLPLAAPPGKAFEYCNGVSHLLSVIIQNTTRMKTRDFAVKYLFEPLGIEDITWETSPRGIDIGYGTLWLQPHDMARFGWLYLNKGLWENRQIISSAWVEASTRGHIAARPFDQYGYQWWVDPAGYYMAVGYRGQRIFVCPAKNLVAVFTADLTGREALMSKKIFDAYVLPAAASSKALPENPPALARLSSLVAGAAEKPPPEIVWVTPDEGTAINGVFKRMSRPAFEFKYPAGSRKSALFAPGQIMRLKTPGGIDLSAGVGDIPEGLKVEDFGTLGYASRLEAEGSQVHVASHTAVTLKCGSKAYQAYINWMWKDIVPITTYLLWAYKDDNVILINAHMLGESYEAEQIGRSLTLR